jgi:hypothetical protein
MPVNIPNVGQKTLRARMKVKSFISPASPDLKQLQTYDQEVNVFLDTIDNQKRFLNGRNSFSIDKKIYTLVWYLERMADEPVTTPFGDKNVKPAEPIIKGIPSVKPDNSPEKK